MIAQDCVLNGKNFRNNKMKKKLFTKSAFKIALECPRRLFYAYDSDLYANQELNDDFLKSLAEGGFQVGELAKIYYGITKETDIDILDYDRSVEITKQLFEKDYVNIAEGAFRYGNLFVRADIIEKKGDEITLIEVKAKSWNPQEDSFCDKKNNVRSAIRPYVYDVAFQKYVITKALKEAYPDRNYVVKARLMMADKSRCATIDGLNQLFRICSSETGRTKIEVDPRAWIEASSTPLQDRVLRAFDVDDLCDRIIAGEVAEQGTLEWMGGMTFEPFVEKMSDLYCNRKKTNDFSLGTQCFSCPFYKTVSDDAEKLDGYVECWKEKARFSDKDFEKPLIKDLSGQFIRRGKFLNEGKYFMDELTPDDLARTAGKNTKGLDHLQRKWLQISIATKNKTLQEEFGSFLKDGIYLDTDGLKETMAEWKFPLHFIDFETSGVALPFYEGMKPYEQVAFQFSHHKVECNGEGGYIVSHASQYINTEKGFFPNFQFVRELQSALEGDNGTIFRYSNHENTILCKIHEQLSCSSEQDRDELMTFIEGITKGGEREMVDLADAVLKYYYHPMMKGSFSIKAVLPSVLNSSDFVKSKYSFPIYGTLQMPSLNLKNKVWIEMDATGKTVKNPYKLLPPIASYIDVDSEVLERMEVDDAESIANGGAALAAYSKLQFSDTVMTDALKKALLCYCELDTLAMVFIWEYFWHETHRTIT